MEAVAELVADADSRSPATTGTRAQAVWMPIFDVRTFTRTGAELHASSEVYVDSQLEAIAPALEIQRDEITVKPPPGWRGYGHPDLFPKTPRRR